MVLSRQVFFVLGGLSSCQKTSRKIWFCNFSNYDTPKTAQVMYLEVIFLGVRTPMVLQCFLYGNHFRPRPVTSDLRLLDFLNKLRQSNTPAKHHQQKQNQPEKKLHLHDGWQANVILARWTWGIVSHDDKVDFDDTSCWFFTKPSEKYAPAQNGQILFPTQLGLKIKKSLKLETHHLKRKRFTSPKSVFSSSNL